MKNRSIFLSKLIWLIATKILYLSNENEEENPMLSGRFVSIRPNDQNEGGSTISIRLKDDTIKLVYSDKENDLKRLKYKPGDMVYLPCIEV